MAGVRRPVDISAANAERIAIQPCLITIWRVNRGVGAYGIRPAIAGGRLAATVARRIRQVCGKGRAYAIRPYACDEAGYF